MNNISNSICGSTHTHIQHLRFSVVSLLTPAITLCGQALFPILFYQRQKNFLVIIMNSNLYKKESLLSNSTNVMVRIMRMLTVNGVSPISQNFLQESMA